MSKIITVLKAVKPSDSTLFGSKSNLPRIPQNQDASRIFNQRGNEGKGRKRMIFT